MMKMNKQAYKTATKCLRKCYGEQGILAGRTHFSDYWARDSFFASFGACILKDFSVVKKNLLLFMRYQAVDGQITLRIGTYNIVPRFLGFKGKKELRARYLVDTIFPSKLKATDCNSLFVIAAANYVKTSKDKSFLRKNYSKIKKAIDWNLSIADNGLIVDKGLTTWDDRIFKRGKVLYTNVLHYKALEDFSFLAKLAKDKASKKYKQLATEVKAKVNKLFWNGKFYADWIMNKKKQNYFSSSGNALAALWIADKNKLKKIDNYVRKNIKGLLPVVIPSYPLNKIWIPIILTGFADYHTSLIWPWISCFYAAALAKLGKKQAKMFLAKVEEQISKHKNCYEVHEQNGKPVNRWFYKSEKPFAWFAGSFIYASYLLQK